MRTTRMRRSSTGASTRHCTQVAGSGNSPGGTTRYGTDMRIPPAPSPFIIRMPSPIGRIELLSDGNALLSLEIETEGQLPHDDRDEAPHRLLARARTQLERYFDGGRAALTVPVLLRGTDFQLAIWNRLRELRRGETISYGTLGAAAGRPGAGRAVGAAVRTNPIPLFVPCHRVLTTDGTVTGWSPQNCGCSTTKRSRSPVRRRGRVHPRPRTQAASPTRRPTPAANPPNRGQHPRR